MTLVAMIVTCPLPALTRAAKLPLIILDNARYAQQVEFWVKRRADLFLRM